MYLLLEMKYINYFTGTPNPQAKGKLAWFHIID